MTQRRSKFKLDIKNKRYTVRDSILFRLRSKKLLGKLLKTELATLKTLTCDSNYKYFTDTSGRKPREIEHPNFALDRVQTRIASLLCRIQQPSYVHSGIKGRSHITNAAVHIGLREVLATDLQSFYQCTMHRMVFDFFHKRMECSTDVADILSRLCTCHGHIPTGSRISMPLAFWANEPLFNILDKVSTEFDIRMTLFVDDLTFSGIKISSRFQQKVDKIIRSHGHSMHPSKTKLYSADAIKVITGVGVGPQGLIVSNKHHKLIYQDLVQWLLTKDLANFPGLNERLLGRLSAQSLIDDRFAGKSRALRAEMRRQGHS